MGNQVQWGMNSKTKGVRMYESARVRSRMRNADLRPLATDNGPPPGAEPPLGRSLTTAGGEGGGIDWNTKSVREYEGSAGSLVRDQGGFASDLRLPRRLILKPSPSGAIVALWPQIGCPHT